MAVHMTETLDNIFEALVDDPAEAADLQFKADLLIIIRKIVAERGWRQKQIGAALGIPQPRVSELMRGRIDLVSAEKLVSYLARLGYSMRPFLTEHMQIDCPVSQVA